MGGGTYSVTNAATTRAMNDFYRKSNNEIFTNRSVDPEMSPKNLGVRESRDSDEHPDSLAIIIGLDVTGSMGSVPQLLIRDGLPTIMDGIIQSGELDPQVLFLGIGDHEVDTAPLQVGQFESSDTLLDKWLLATYLEGGGGGNMGESYLLAWYFAAMHTSIDCFEKRNRKGLVITIGDEPTLRTLSAAHQRSLLGEGQYIDRTDTDLLELAQASYDVYHLHLLSTGAGTRWRNNLHWKELLGDKYISVKTPKDIPSAITEITANHSKSALTNKTTKVGDVNEEPGEIVL